ncbi:ABC transporter permease subunit [Parvularcula sp. BGMRC 0090]|uniref:ABC transporter permease subunit n=2 Tax=Parvularcula maris TaxID=2965077 RepID=A0A9X2L7X1_9PROT|nr:ABC transporter permease subunit [Parvularcula maris]
MPRRRRDVQDWAGLLGAALTSGLAAAVLASALLLTIGQAVGGASRWTGEGLRSLLAAPGIGRSALLSLTTGLAATAIAYGGAMALAALAAEHSAKREGAMKLLLAVPHTAVALGLAFLLAPSGLLARAVSPFFGWEAPPQFPVPGDPFGIALTLGLAAKELPFLFIMVLTAIRTLPTERLAAQTAALGYRPLRGWLSVQMPLIHKQTGIAALIALVYAVGASEQGLILGPTLGAPLPVRLIEWFTDPDLSARSTLAAGSLLLVLIALAAAAIWEAALRAGGAIMRTRLQTGRRSGFGERLIRPVRYACLGLLVAAVLGLLGLCLSSFAGPWRFPDLLPRSLTLTLWRQQGELLTGPFATSGLLAVLSAPIATLIGLGAGELVRGRALLSRILTAVLLSLLLVPEPVLMFGLGTVLTLWRADGGLMGALLLHLVYAVPYAFLLLRAADAAIPANLERAARSLGATRRRAFLTIRLPLLAPAIAASLFLTAIISVGLYLPTLVGGAGRVASLTTEGVALAAGDRRMAGAFALMLTSLPILLLLLSEGVRRAASKRGSGHA